MDNLGLYGPLAGILAFLLAMTRVFMLDRGWRDLLREVRHDLASCSDERARLAQELSGLRSEVMILRQELHVARWKETAP